MGVEKEPNTGENDDRVRIRLGNDADVRIVETYDFHSSILQQPAAFAIHLSGGQGAAEVMKKYPPGPDGKCSLFIGKQRQFTGELDAVNATGDANSTTVELTGRDMMARLHDTDIVGERSFNNATYEELFRAALDSVDQAGKTIDPSNTANRKVRSGANVKVIQEPVKTSEIRTTGSGAKTKVKAIITTKMGESWLQFLERHFAKLGLFAWADAKGNFVLSRPNGAQEPTFAFFRKRGNASSVSNVKRFSFTNDTTHRFSHMVIFCRNHGKKYGHNHANGRFDDVEMMRYGINRLRVFRDAQVNSVEEAEYFARKKIAELNRACWKLVYTISGHSAPLLKEIDKRAIVCPDMVARVDDDELGIHENLYIESVQYKSPPRETVITMMRPADLIFGENQAIVGNKKKLQYVNKKAAERKAPPPKKETEFEALQRDILNGILSKGYRAK